MQNQQAVAAAVEDFRQARRQAAMQEILSRVTGEPVDLLSFDEVRAKLKTSGGISRGLQEIPLNAIVGSVGRYKDFTRGFLPRQDANQYRWANVKAATTDLTGVPPIEVYQIGDAYFVLDGNHRVSVARQLGESYIQAYVTEFKSKIPLSPQDNPDDLLLKAEYTDFLEQTKLDKLRPEADLRLTEPGRYWQLTTQIAALHFMMGQEQGQEIPYADAVRRWYDHVYLPIIRVIRERGILRDFPHRTETDLYLWIFNHRAALEKKSGWRIDPETAADDLITTQGENTERVVARVEEKLFDAITPDSLESGPAVGQWRRDRVEARTQDRLFDAILTPLSGAEESWRALEQALLIAGREKSRLYGLHVVSSEAESESEAAQAVKNEFKQRCEAAGVPGELSIEVGPIARKITERARWTDLVVMHLAHPPDERVLSRLGSGLRTVLYRCPRPVLTASGDASALDHALLAYDGSPKAQEGLFVAAYLACQWRISLTVLTVAQTEQQYSLMDQAREHLEKRGLTATFLTKEGTAAQKILETIAEQKCNLLIMGGYGRSSVVEVILGSVVDQVLRETNLPALICR